jgi:hypothetical protein
VTRLEALRGGWRTLVLYGLLGLVSFPTFGHLLAGQQGLAYAHDVFELPRTGVLQDWLANGLTLWNTHLTDGNALLAQQWNTPFAIDVALGFLLGPFGAYVVDVWLLAAVAGLSMHLFLRDSLRLSTFAVVAGATIYALGFWQYSYGAAAPAFPLLLWLMDRALTPGHRRWAFILGGGLGGAVVLYHGLSQVVVLAAVVQLGYILVTAPDRRALPRRALIWSATWLIAFGLYSPVLVTQLVMLPISNRTIWDLVALYHPTAIQAVGDTLLRYSQLVIGVPIGGGIGASPAQFGTFFAGAIGLPALVLGVVGVHRDRREWFLLALLVVIPTLDLLSVLFTPIQQQLGLLKSFQFDRIAHLYPFVVVVNVAIGIELLATTVIHGEPLRLGARWRWAIVGASLVALMIALAFAIDQVIRRRRELMALAAPALGWALLAAALAVGLLCVAFLALGTLRAQRIGAQRFGTIAVLGLLLVLAGDRAAYAWGERLTAPGDTLGTWAATLSVDSAEEFLLRQPGIAIERVLSFGGPPNRLAAAGMLQVDGYQSIYPVTYHAFFGALIGPQVAASPSLATYYGKWGNRAVTFGPAVDPVLVALSGAQWLYVVGPEVPTIPGIVPRFHQGDLTVYEVPNVLPRAFLAGSIAVRPDPAAVVAALSTADLTAVRGSAFVTAAAAQDLLGAGLPASPAAAVVGSATIASYTPDRVVVDVQADRPGVLVLTDVMAPGWVAERDGTSVPIATVDGTFRGVAVTSSTHEVVFRYVPVFTYAGFALALICLLAAVGWALAVRHYDGKGRKRDATSH